MIIMMQTYSIKRILKLSDIFHIYLSLSVLNIYELVKVQQLIIRLVSSYQDILVRMLLSVFKDVSPIIRNYIVKATFIYYTYIQDMKTSSNNKISTTLVILIILSIMGCPMAQQHAQPQIQNPSPSTAQAQTGNPSSTQPTQSAPIVVEPEIIQARADDVVQPVVQPNVVDPIATQPSTPSANVNTDAPVVNPQPAAAVVPNIQITAQVNPTIVDSNTQPVGQNSEQNQQQLNSGAAAQVEVQQNHNIMPEHAQQQAEQTFQKNQAMGQGQPRVAQPKGQNFDQPNAQRSARYRAQQQRIMEIKRRQQQLERQQQQQQRLRQAQNQRFSRIQQARQTERQNMHKVMAQDIGMIPRKSVLFEVDKKIQEFYLNPTEQTDIILKLSIYVLKDNAYSMVRDIDTAGVLKMYVYQDNNRIVGQSQCFFMSAVIFKAKPKSTYTIRFYNQGITKLISLTFPQFVSTSVVQNLYSQSKRHLHLWKTQVLGLRIRELTDQLRLNSMMDFHNANTLISALRLYSFYQFLEILMVVALAGTQVYLVKKMFKSDSIL